MFPLYEKQIIHGPYLISFFWFISKRNFSRYRSIYTLREKEWRKVLEKIQLAFYSNTLDPIETNTFEKVVQHGMPFHWQPLRHRAYSSLVEAYWKNHNSFFTFVFQKNWYNVLIFCCIIYWQEVTSRQHLCVNKFTDTKKKIHTCIYRFIHQIT